MSKLNPGNIINISDIDTATVVRCLTPESTCTDTGIDLYEVACDDGQHEVMAVDNGGTWLVGDADDDYHALCQFRAIRKANGDGVEWEAIESDTLREGIKARMAEVSDESKVLGAMILRHYAGGELSKYVDDRTRDIIASHDAEWQAAETPEAGDAVIDAAIDEIVEEVEEIDYHG